MTTAKKTKETKEKKPAKNTYFEAIGRRKTSVARVRLFNKGEAGIIVNNKDFKKYFPTAELHNVIEDPLKKMKLAESFKITVKTSGGGVSSQAEAVRLGISRALVKFNAEFRKRLKKAGFLKRDPRTKERRKFGLKKARKAPQWSKR